MLQEFIDEQKNTLEVNSEVSQEQTFEDGYIAPSKEDRRRKLMEGLKSSLYDVPQKKGWVRHFFNDVGSRIQDRLDLGWRFVEIKNPEEKRYYHFHVKGNKVNIRAGTKKDGSDLIQYLLEIPEQIYQENKFIKDEIRRKPYKDFARKAIEDSEIPEDERFAFSKFKAEGKHLQHLK